jgi:hypothetical protein
LDTLEKRISVLPKCMRSFPEETWRRVL